MIQPPRVALQHENGTKLFHRAVLELHTVEYWYKNYISTHNLVHKALKYINSDNTVIILRPFFFLSHARLPRHPKLS